MLARLACGSTRVSSARGANRAMIDIENTRGLSARGASAVMIRVCDRQDITNRRCKRKKERKKRSLAVLACNDMISRLASVKKVLDVNMK